MKSGSCLLGIQNLIINENSFPINNSHKLRRKRSRPKPMIIKTHEFLIDNLTKILTTHEIQLLEKGVSFCPTSEPNTLVLVKAVKLFREIVDRYVR